jgi:hypothetical protein
LPIYNLDEMRQAASKQRINYAGRKVNKDIANLGYTLQDVVNCIVSLTVKDFKESVTYPEKSYDVYIKDVVQTEQTDRVYMKLRLEENGEIKILEIGSFHL